MFQAFLTGLSALLSHLLDLASRHGNHFLELSRRILLLILHRLEQIYEWRARSVFFIRLLFNQNRILGGVDHVKRPISLQLQLINSINPLGADSELLILS